MGNTFDPKETIEREVSSLTSEDVGKGLYYPQIKEWGNITSVTPKGDRVYVNARLKENDPETGKARFVRSDFSEQTTVMMTEEKIDVRRR